jgi:predicted nucleic acid-binding Zn ribbon protein
MCLEIMNYERHEINIISMCLEIMNYERHYI